MDRNRTRTGCLSGGLCLRGSVFSCFEISGPGDECHFRDVNGKGLKLTFPQARVATRERAGSGFFGGRRVSCLRMIVSGP